MNCPCSCGSGELCDNLWNAKNYQFPRYCCRQPITKLCWNRQAKRLCFIQHKFQTQSGARRILSISLWRATAAPIGYAVQWGYLDLRHLRTWHNSEYGSASCSLPAHSWKCPLPALHPETSSSCPLPMPFQTPVLAKSADTNCGSLERPVTRQKRCVWGMEVMRRRGSRMGRGWGGGMPRGSKVGGRRDCWSWAPLDPEPPWQSEGAQTE